MGLRSRARTELVARFNTRWLSGLLGVVVLVAFVTERFLAAVVGLSPGDLPAYLLGGVVVAVALSGLSGGVTGRDLRTAVAVSLGPAGGLLLYLVGYHLFYPVSADSPTWLLYVAFAGGYLALGTTAHLCGRVWQLAS